MAHHLGLWNLLGESTLCAPRSCPPNQRIVQLQRPGFRYTRKAHQQLGTPVFQALLFPVERKSCLSQWSAASLFYPDQFWYMMTLLKATRWLYRLRCRLSSHQWGC